MAALVGGEAVSFAQLPTLPPGDPDQLLYEGRIEVPAGSYIIDVYWYCRSGWDAVANLDAVAEGGYLSNGVPGTLLFDTEPAVGNAGAGRTFRDFGGVAAGEKAVVSDATQDFVFSIVENVNPSGTRVGVTFVGVIWIVPGVTVSDPPVVI